jgi:DNA-binding transcriptional LysR family regulator
MNEHIDGLKDWDAVRTAYQVARLGTLSAAAKHLGVHHATVIRHINALEAALGTKLFQRHPRGYTPTEAGVELMKTAASTEDQFAQLTARLKGQENTVSGDLTITALSVLSPWLTPVLAGFQAQYPDVRINLVLDERLLRLESGEAHLAVRAGPEPQEPDNIVRRIGNYPASMFAHRDYVARFGMMDSLDQAAQHRFVAGIGPAARAPMFGWLKDNVPDTAVVFRSTDTRSLEDAVMAGAGIGFLSLERGRTEPDLVQICPPNPIWGADLWLVSHVDIARTAKVRAVSAHMLRHLKPTVDI